MHALACYPKSNPDFLVSQTSTPQFYCYLYNFFVSASYSNWGAGTKRRNSNLPSVIAD